MGGGGVWGGEGGAEGAPRAGGGRGAPAAPAARVAACAGDARLRISLAASSRCANLPARYSSAPGVLPFIDPHRSFRLHSLGYPLASS